MQEAQPSVYALKKNQATDIPEAELLWTVAEALDLLDNANSPEKVEDRNPDVFNRLISNVRQPALYAFPAVEGNNCGRAVVICPGGGYVGVAIDHEGFELARKFNALGYSAFVLKYRDPAPDGKMGTFPFGPLDDALRAMRLVRSRASRYGIDPTRIGIMGFSSGGHVAATASTLYATRHDPNPQLDSVSARPDFSLLIYPVIALDTPWCHGGSRERLLNVPEDSPKAHDMTPYYHIDAQTPPVFLISTSDDAVDCRNSINYFLACREAGVKAEIHIYAEGGHGYGMRRRSIPVDTWSNRMNDWLTKLF